MASGWRRRVAEWRAAGETIVFTNGCFDLLHVGHVTLLEECHRFGSKLVLGLNSDASVCRLKGPTRPVVGESERARVMAALAAVDAVVVFEEDTPLELIRAVKPDVLVKGGDYSHGDGGGARRGDRRRWTGGDCADGGGIFYDEYCEQAEGECVRLAERFRGKQPEAEANHLSPHGSCEPPPELACSRRLAGATDN